jgi:intein/homing endonuclease
MQDDAYNSKLPECSQFCFAAGTLIHTERGLVPIEQIQIGDMVLSKHESGEGELVYKPVVRTFMTDNVPVYAMQWSPDQHIGMSLTEIYELREKYKDNYVLVTANHPFWVEDRGWIRADEIRVNEILILKDGTRVTLSSSTLDNKMIDRVYRTQNAQVGFIPDYGDDVGSSGTFIDLSSGERIDERVESPEALSKLYIRDRKWKTKLLAQIPESEREEAEFHGFRQGYWVDPETIKWDEGEGPLRTTVYNIEVADTHTYFVGKGGVWVHDNSQPA